MNRTVTRRSIAASLRSAPIQRDLLAYLETRLDDERETYETTAASELQRGRITMLKDIIALVKE